MAQFSVFLGRATTNRAASSNVNMDHIVWQLFSETSRLLRCNILSDPSVSVYLLDEKTVRVFTNVAHSKQLKFKVTVNWERRSKKCDKLVLSNLKVNKVTTEPTAPAGIWNTKRFKTH
jgi:hypothetical protein